MADDRRLTELLDREAIRDCIYRYCRGVDRADEASLRSSYWPDATDCHGSYSGPVEGFFQWALSVFKTGARNIHQVGNILIEFKGDNPRGRRELLQRPAARPRSKGEGAPVLARRPLLRRVRKARRRMARRQARGRLRLGRGAACSGGRGGGAFRQPQAGWRELSERSDLRVADVRCCLMAVLECPSHPPVSDNL